MKLFELEVENWRSLYGKHPPIKFSTDETRPVTVIHASNHAGKTNLVNALLWLFNPKVTTDNFKTRQGIVHTQTVADTKVGEEVSCRVELLFQHEGKFHRAVRTASAIKTDDMDTVPISTPTRLEIHIQNETGAWSPCPSPQFYLDNVIPECVRNFFFFAGEDSSSKFSDGRDAKRRLANQMRTFYKLDAISSSQQALKGALRYLTEQIEVHGDADIQLLAQQQTKLTNERESFKRENNERQERILTLEKKIAAADQNLSANRESARLATDRAVCNEQIDTCKMNIEAAKESQRKRIGTDGYTVFLGKQLKYMEETFAKLKATNKLPTPLKKPFVQALIDENQCICKRPLTTGSDAHNAIQEWLNQAGIPAVEDKLRVMKRQVEEIGAHKTELWEQLGKFQGTLNSERDKRALLEKNVANLTEKLGSLPNEDIQQLEKSRKRWIEDRTNTTADIAVAVSQIDNIDKQFADLQTQIDKHEAETAISALAVKKQRVCSKAVDLIGRLFMDTDLKIRTELQDAFIANYSQLAITDYTAVIDESYLLEVWDPNGISVDLSGAQSNDVAVAYITALLDVYRRQRIKTATEHDDGEFTLVLDAPFGVMSNLYAKKMAEFLNGKVEQLVVLLTDKQWKGDVEKSMGPRVGKHCMMRFYHQRIGLEEENETVDVEGQSYSYYAKTDDDFEYAKIIDMG